MTDATTPEQPTLRGIANLAHLAWTTSKDEIREAFERIEDLALAIEAQARPAVASEGLRAAAKMLRKHRPTVWPDGPSSELIHCDCGLKDHPAGWWAHIVVGVMEHDLSAALASVPPPTPTAATAPAGAGWSVATR